ncbi:MAG: ice-binding family protein [Rudaea sp.]|nr:ice-binding family protein [Rudaea sp.]
MLAMRGRKTSATPAGRALMSTLPVGARQGFPLLVRPDSLPARGKRFLLAGLPQRQERPVRLPMRMMWQAIMCSYRYRAMTADAAFPTRSPYLVARLIKAKFRPGQNISGLLAGLGFAVFACLLPDGAVLAATAPNLGSTSTYGVVSDTFTNANTSPQTTIDGDVCFTTGPTTPPLNITGTTSTPCPPQTGVDEGLALASLNGQVCTSLGAGAVALDSIVVGTNPPGTIPPGCYSSGGAMSVTVSTTVTLNGAGVYIFRPGGALTTGADSTVVLANGACSADVYWAPVGAATLGANSASSSTPTFVGNILDDAGITIGHFANMTGSALAFGGTVTTDANTITVASCAPLSGGTAAAIPTLSEWLSIVLCMLLAIAGIAATGRRAMRSNAS